MCSVCMTTQALAPAGVTSIGDITTLVASRLRSKNKQEQGENYGEPERASSNEHTADRVGA
jgi:hypothetical protein